MTIFRLFCADRLAAEPRRNVRWVLCWLTVTGVLTALLCTEFRERPRYSYPPSGGLRTYTTFGWPLLAHQTWKDEDANVSRSWVKYGEPQAFVFMGAVDCLVVIVMTLATAIVMRRIGGPIKLRQYGLRTLLGCIGVLCVTIAFTENEWPICERLAITVSGEFGCFRGIYDDPLSTRIPVQIAVGCTIFVFSAALFQVMERNCPFRDLRSARQTPGEP